MAGKSLYCLQFKEKRRIRLLAKSYKVSKSGRLTTYRCNQHVIMYCAQKYKTRRNILILMYTT